MNNAVSTRPAAVAGMFYPDEPEVLEGQLHQFLTSARDTNIQPKVMVLPHAGYIFSGQCAAEGYHLLEPMKDKISKVVLLGPSHRVRLRGIAAPESTVFETPLGNIDIDTEAVSKLDAMPYVLKSDLAHEKEHSLEVHLPFLQKVLGDFTLIPLVVGQTRPQEVASVLESLWGGEETIIIISSDLSHYHDYNKATMIDRNTAEKIVNMQADIVGEEACGCFPLNGFLSLAKKKHMQSHCIDICNSGDTAGDKRRVVGYGAFAFTEQASSGQGEGKQQRQQQPLNPDQQKALLQIARKAIEHAFKTGKRLQLKDISDPVLKLPGASFVTLTINKQLRGCIGTLEARQPLFRDICENAVNAAFNDRRFKPLTPEEFKQVHIEISVLEKPVPMQFESEQDLLQQIQPGLDGLVFEEGQHRSTFLPIVWDKIPSKQEFIAQLKLKAGLPADYWSGSIKMSRYRTQIFEE